MKVNGECELSDIPRLLQSWRDHGRPGDLLMARSALVEACESIMGNAEATCRALTPDERRAFDCHSQQIRSINSDLAEYKRKRIAGIVALGWDASELRLPF